ncbi:hypothetical protein FOZ60_014420 [Perkinsus olseni]|uniref:Uncharacterized protein n=1 Tax=Perkinsus olseni TaxID=32597 RepID=A0A7J6P797_PEROL|nr:hypothetical protein FOZ60_014420 [Perkinsus olseni]
MLCNAYAKAGIREGDAVLRFLVPNIMAKSADFTGVDCAIVLNAFARLKINDRAVLKRLSKRVTELLRRTDGSSLSRVATQSLNAMVKLNFTDADFVEAVLLWAEGQSTDIASWTPQDVSLFCHGIVKAGGRPSVEFVAPPGSHGIGSSRRVRRSSHLFGLGRLRRPRDASLDGAYCVRVGRNAWPSAGSKSAKDAVYGLHAMAKVGYYDWEFLESVVIGTLSSRMGALTKHTQLIAMLSPDIASYLTEGRPTDSQRSRAEEFLSTVVEMLQGEPRLMKEGLSSGQLAMFLLGLARCNHGKAIDFASAAVPLLVSKMAPVSGDARPLTALLNALALLDFIPQKALMDLLGQANWERVSWGNSIQQFGHLPQCPRTAGFGSPCCPTLEGAAHAVAMATGVLPRTLLGGLVHLDKAGCRQVLGALLSSGVKNLEALPLETLRELSKAEVGTPRAGNGRSHSEVGMVLQLQMGMPVVSETVAAGLFLIDLRIDVSDAVDVS